MKKIDLVSTLAVIIVISAASGAYAVDLDANSRGIINFDALDTDQNGVITQTEFDVSPMFKGEKFSDLDADDNGAINGEELSIWARTNGKGNAVGSVHTKGIIGTTGNIGIIPQHLNRDASGKALPNHSETQQSSE